MTKKLSKEVKMSVVNDKKVVKGGENEYGQLQ